MLKRILGLVLLAVPIVFLFLHAGSYLVVNTPEHADLIVVLAGDNNDLRYESGVKLMREGYAAHLVLDVFAKGKAYGHLYTDLAQELLDKTTPGLSTICPIWENSTYDEARYLKECLAGLNVKSVLVVTSAYHTRRAREIFRQRLPQYHFSFYAAPDPYYFGTPWWTDRQWAKTTLAEWQRYVWWELADRWRSGLVVQ